MGGVRMTLAIHVSSKGRRQCYVMLCKWSCLLKGLLVRKRVT